MAFLLLKRKPCSIPLPFFKSYFSASPALNPDPQNPNFSVVDYLIASFGFSPDKAARVSKNVARIKSPEKPDSVLRFLKQKGFSEAEIQKVITGHPALLSSTPDITFKPNLDALRDMGLSDSTISQIVLASPSVLRLHSAVPRIKFWWDFFEGSEKSLVRCFKKYSTLTALDIGKNIVPKISLLQRHGFSGRDISRFALRIPRFFHTSTGSMEKILERTKELGFEKESGMFLAGLTVMSCVTRESLQKKMEILKSFGWSEDDFLSALQTSPNMVMISYESLRAKMDFLLGEVKVDPSYVVSRPVLLTYSLEKRLKPRHQILQLLEQKGLSEKGKGFFTAILMNNNQFLEKHIHSHKNEIPELHQVYLAACSSCS